MEKNSPTASSPDERSLIERLARHLAAGQPENWRERMEDAASILAILKEPDAPMREAGDEHAWRAMIDAALRERWVVAPASAGTADTPGGFDEEGDTPLSQDADTQDRAGWVHSD
ncbi:MAG: hypothetical protein ABW164_11125 [Sphingobium sp.]